jgi:hypothetical protein
VAIKEKKGRGGERVKRRIEDQGTQGLRDEGTKGRMDEGTCE